MTDRSLYSSTGGGKIRKQYDLYVTNIPCIYHLFWSHFLITFFFMNPMGRSILSTGPNQPASRAAGPTTPEKSSTPTGRSSDLQDAWWPCSHHSRGLDNLGTRNLPTSHSWGLTLQSEGGDLYLLRWIPSSRSWWNLHAKNLLDAQCALSSALSSINLFSVK